MTAVSSLLRKYNVDPNSIGRLEVGTETLIDKSKSVKSVLMQLFPENSNIEGVDTVNACYGGTNAVLNAVNWIECSAWDGRDAIVVAGDIALYKKGNARPTGGAGCVALLIGPNAPVVLEPIRGSYMAHVYDFYKPDLTSEYPYVDGHYSIRCYTEAIDACYKAYNSREKLVLSNGTYTKNGTNGVNGVNGHKPVNGTNGANGVNGHNGTNGHSAAAEANGINSIHKEVPLDRFDYMAFHAPTCKLVSKSYARMLYNDYLSDPKNPFFAEVTEGVRDLDYAASISDKTIEKTFMSLVSPSPQPQRPARKLTCSSRRSASPAASSRPSRCRPCAATCTPAASGRAWSAC